MFGRALVVGRYKAEQLRPKSLFLSRTGRVSNDESSGMKPKLCRKSPERKDVTERAGRGVDEASLELRKVISNERGSKQTSEATCTLQKMRDRPRVPVSVARQPWLPPDFGHSMAK